MKAYLDEFQQVLHDPDRLGDTASRWQHSPDDTTQRGLRFYTRSARARRLGFVNHAFPGFLKSLGKDRAAAEKAFIAHPSGGDPDWSRNAAGFVDAVRAMVQRQELPPAAADNATHHWAMYELDLVREAPEPADGIANLAINPTLDARQYPRDPTTGKLEPESAQPVMIGYFVDPETKAAQWLRLDPGVFALMRVVDEQIPHERAASEAGMELEALRSRLYELASKGLFVQRA